MSLKPIILKNISLIINKKICFEDFNAQIQSGKHILIIGKNGVGKSTLCKIIQGSILPTHGNVKIPEQIIFGYVPQTVADYPELSGGQRFNKALSKALSLMPDVLILDEPTNHLDLSNKQSLIRMLQKYNNTTIIISHDPEILNLNFDEIWDLENESIKIFCGTYSEMLKEKTSKNFSLETKREKLKKEKRQIKKLVEKEKKRNAQSKFANKNENDRTLIGLMKESGSISSGKNLKRLSNSQQKIQEELSTNFIHKKIEPNFNLKSIKNHLNKAIVEITNGSCGYTNFVLENINLQIKFGDKIAIVGNNASGKSTFLKTLLNDFSVQKNGIWLVPSTIKIGYLDQHYSSLNPNITVEEIIKDAAPDWDNLKIRKHLNDFLFITPQDVNNKVENLSGGEKARLSLAQIAAQGTHLLLLDEITNNVDIETRQHIIEVLKKYPGSIVIVSHDPTFIEELNVDIIYKIKNNTLIFEL